jgi:NAD+ synthase
MMSSMPKLSALDQDVLSIDTDLVTELLQGFIADEVRKVGFGRVILGLSGGVDSALACVLACKALGAENVVPVIMPYRESNPTSQQDAEAVCKDFGLTPTVVDISAQIDAYFEKMPDANKARRGNKMARERMTILYDLSFAKGALVLGTSNKTELLLGYGTIFGDMASALNPIGDLYKTQVYQLSAAVGVPKVILDKAPSADLWQGQTDEEELGFSYRMVDSLFYYLVDERRTQEECVDLGFEEGFIAAVQKRIQDSQYKRRPPLIAKLSQRTIDRDFRYPRDWGH